MNIGRLYRLYLCVACRQFLNKASQLYRRHWAKKIENSSEVSLAYNPLVMKPAPGERHKKVHILFLIYRQ